jgi:hypothetical protein
MSVLKQPTDDVHRKLTTITYPDQGQPVWRVSGPAGAVSYHSRDHQLIVQPKGMSGEPLPVDRADEARLVANKSDGDKDMYVLLTAHYHAMAAEHAGQPAGVAAWRALRGAALTDAILNGDWYAWPDDTIGGWAIMPINVPPSAGAPIIGSFLDERTARHITEVHNDAVAADCRRRQNQDRATADQEAWRRRIAPVADVIQLGDLVFIPAGVDSLYRVNMRFRVDRITGRGVSGSRIKTNGEPVKSNSIPEYADEHGNIPRMATWTELLKCTIYRDGKPVYTPGETQ